jgi:hypothetical protein
MPIAHIAGAPIEELLMALALAGAPLLHKLRR